MRLERGPLSSDAFVVIAKKVVPFVHIASKIRGEKYPELFLKVGMGWPQAAIFDSRGRFIARVETSALRVDGAAAIETVMSSEVAAFYELKKKASKGGKKAKATFLMARFDRGHLTSVEMREAIGTGSILNSFQREAVRETLVDTQTAECLKGIDSSRPETFGPYAKKLLAQHREIGLPEGPAGIAAWRVVMEDAYLRKDASAFAIAFTAIKATGITSKKFAETNQKRLQSIQKADK